MPHPIFQLTGLFLTYSAISFNEFWIELLYLHLQRNILFCGGRRHYLSGNPTHIDQKQRSTRSVQHVTHGELFSPHSNLFTARLIAMTTERRTRTRPNTLYFCQLADPFLANAGLAKVGNGLFIVLLTLNCTRIVLTQLLFRTKLVWPRNSRNA